MHESIRVDILYLKIETIDGDCSGDHIQHVIHISRPYTAHHAGHLTNARNQNRYG